ncbi:unnamed protein product [Colias eurytheme]|nr:unnamed protein product [Colias eurytheme]
MRPVVSRTTLVGLLPGCWYQRLRVRRGLLPAEWGNNLTTWARRPEPWEPPPCADVLREPIVADRKGTLDDVFGIDPP